MQVFDIEPALHFLVLLKTFKDITKIMFSNVNWATKLQLLSCDLDVCREFFTSATRTDVLMVKYEKLNENNPLLFDKQNILKSHNVFTFKSETLNLKGTSFREGIL